ncbi:Mth938-like domain-containing protein [Halalkalibaculum sp. DA3122]|uniref:Mth938-like domain-containing protein n=1 Tax=Halalkalibaculum sp. DA3122 TaxID=3373607 RepID=UPI003754757E
MRKEQISPEISKLRWGTVELSGGQRYKDVKLYPGGSREWDWNETGTSHVPGIQPADVGELLEHNAEVVILSKGINQRLQVKSETERMLQNNGVEYHILQSEKAVDKYNELRKDRPVGALIHSTC